MSRAGAIMLSLGAMLAAGDAAALDCPPAPAPILSLDYDSRYEDEDETRSEIDPDANAEVDASQKPVDDFIRELAAMANQVHEPDAPTAEISDCVVSQIAQWARAGALLDLKSDTVRMTFGSRLAGISLALRQVRGFGGATADWQDIRIWLSQLSRAQMLFWEEDAPDGARRGNLRAWAALGLAATADVLQDPIMRGWAAWSAEYVICTANSDGSLPQEMTRGRLALHYQLHATAPLVVTARLLSEHGYDLRAACDSALDRIVSFSLSDAQNGARSRAITGEVQSYFDGSRELTGYHLAWLEAYLSMVPDIAAARQTADRFRPLSSSKLGGDQTAMWR